MKSFKKIASLFLALCMAVSVFTVPSSAAAGSVKEAIIIGSTGDPVVKVLFDIPEDLENVVGIQFTLTAPEKFTIKSVESSVEGWEFDTNPVDNSATVILDDGKGGTDSALFLENVATASFEGLYELATVEMTPADDVVAGNYEISVVVEDIAVYDPASDTEDGIVNNENSEAVIRTFEYAALSHAWDAGVDTTPATCTTDGVKTFTCGTCGDTKTETIPALDHDIVVDKAVAPTCTETGLTEGSHCSRCDDATIKQEVVPALNHAWDEGKETTPATCTKEGVKTFTCGTCGETKTETIKVVPHKLTDLKAVAATCTTAGKTAGKQCSVCKTITVAQKATAALGHKEVALAAVAATYEKTGLTAGKKCSVCNNVTVAQKVVPALAKTSLKKAKFTLKAKTYTGKALTQSFTVKLGSKTLKNKIDYTISYKNNKNIGKATVTIKGIGAYKDSVSKTFAINPKKLTGLKVKAGKKQLTVSWKKDSKVGGYEIVYATSKNFKSGKKTVKISKAKTVKKVIKKLKSKKTYYVKVRSFKKVGGKTYCGAYTSVKSIKVK